MSIFASVTAVTRRIIGSSLGRHRPSSPVVKTHKPLLHDARPAAQNDCKGLSLSGLRSLHQNNCGPSVAHNCQGGILTRASLGLGCSSSPKSNPEKTVVHNAQPPAQKDPKGISHNGLRLLHQNNCGYSVAPSCQDGVLTRASLGLGCSSSPKSNPDETVVHNAEPPAQTDSKVISHNGLRLLHQNNRGYCDSFLYRAFLGLGCSSSCKRNPDEPVVYALPPALRGFKIYRDLRLLYQQNGGLSITHDCQSDEIQKNKRENTIAECTGPVSDWCHSDRLRFGAFALYLSINLCPDVSHPRNDVTGTNPSTAHPQTPQPANGGSRGLATVLSTTRAKVVSVYSTVKDWILTSVTRIYERFRPFGAVMYEIIEEIIRTLFSTSYLASLLFLEIGWKVIYSYRIAQGIRMSCICDWDIHDITLRENDTTLRVVFSEREQNVWVSFPFSHIILSVALNKPEEGILVDFSNKEEGIFLLTFDKKQYFMLGYDIPSEPLILYFPKSRLVLLLQFPGRLSRILALLERIILQIVSRIQNYFQGPQLASQPYSYRH